MLFVGSIAIELRQTANYRMTWLKKRLRQLGLHRKGPSVTYSPIPVISEAIKVNIFPISLTEIPTGGTKRKQ